MLISVNSSLLRCLLGGIGIAALTTIHGCASHQPVEKTTGSASPEITCLPGYWEDDVTEPVFGGKIHLLKAGPVDCPPVLLVHGLGDNGARDWESLIPQLSQRYRVIAPDLPGFARSTKANTLYSPTRYVAVLDWLVRQNTSGKIDVVGHSLGGAVALLYAGTHPDRVRRLILADVAGVLDRHVFVGYLASGKQGPFTRMKDRQGEVMGFALPALLGLSKTFELNPYKLLESHKAREKRLDGDPRKIAGLALILHNFGPAISAVDMPTLLIWGSEDPIAPLRTGVVLDERLRNARLEVLEGGGHVPMIDLPQQFNVKIMDFLNAPEVALAAKPDRSSDFIPGRSEHAKERNSPVFEGDFDRLEIEDCEKVQIRDARIKELVVKRSAVTIERTEILGGEYGIDVDGSQLRMTGGAISGQTAIRTAGSIIDFAGVLIEAKHNVLECTRSSQVVYSVCPVKRRGGLVVYRHGFRAVPNGQKLP